MNASSFSQGMALLQRESILVPKDASRFEPTRRQSLVVRDLDRGVVVATNNGKGRILSYRSRDLISTPGELGDLFSFFREHIGGEPSTGIIVQGRASPSELYEALKALVANVGGIGLPYVPRLGHLADVVQETNGNVSVRQYGDPSGPAHSRMISETVYDLRSPRGKLY